MMQQIATQGAKQRQDSSIDRNPRDLYDIAYQAGRLVQAQRPTAEENPPTDPTADGDRVSSRFILNQIRESFGEEVSVIDEENKSAFYGIQSSRVFVVDPLDGTREFLRGKDQWGICMAEVLDGTPCNGVIHFPALSQSITSKRDRNVTFHNCAQKSGASGIFCNYGPWLLPETFPELSQDGISSLFGGTVIFDGASSYVARNFFLRGGAMILPLVSVWESPAIISIARQLGKHIYDSSGDYLNPSHRTVVVADSEAELDAIVTKLSPLIPRLLELRREWNTNKLRDAQLAVKEIGFLEVVKLLQDPTTFVLDVRSVDEFNVSRLPTDRIVRIPHNDPHATQAALERHDLSGKRVISTCLAGGRSRVFRGDHPRINHQPLLLRQGIKEVFHYSGGHFDWFCQGGRLIDSSNRPVNRLRLDSEESARQLLESPSAQNGKFSIHTSYDERLVYNRT